METIRYNFVSRVNTFFTIIAIIFAICLSNGNYSYAQTPKTVGTPGGDYATLGAAFDAINLGELTGAPTGVITLQIISSITEPGTASLNASGGSVSYTSVNIYPTFQDLTIGGEVSGAPLINLNGANNVTFDGRVDITDETKNLTISNTSTSTDPGTSTIRFINDASTNTVKYCNIMGSTTDAATGIIFFSTTTGSTGNDGNTIYNNNITNAADANRPINAIYSLGSSESATNSGNTISNNNIYDFFNGSYISYGINISSYTTAWTITGNSFYETTSFAPTASVEYRIINIDNTSGINFTVSNNYIGGTSASCGGTVWTKTSAFDNTFSGIYLNVGTSTASNVQGNTIKNFSYANSGGSNWCGINIALGDVNVGTNIIGFSSDNTYSITFTSGATGAIFYGIYIQSTGTVTCQSNIISSITTINASTKATHFYGIYKTNAGTTTISNNLIGSTTPNSNSINASSISTGNAQNVYGINSAGTGTVTISGNTISNLRNGTTNSTATTPGLIQGIYISGGTNTIKSNIVKYLTIANGNTNSGASVSVGGIIFNSTTATAQTISNNTISGLLNTYSNFTGSVIGLYYKGGTTASTVNGNFINNLSASTPSNTAPNTICGIKINAGATTYSNNVISLNGYQGSALTGIYETGALSDDINNLYFNTIYLGGIAGFFSGKNATSRNSFALYSTGTTNKRNFRNNIIENARINYNGTLGKQYAVYLNYGDTTNLTMDYNDYYAPGSGGTFGHFSSADVTTLADWKTTPLGPGQDVYSKNTTPQFTFVENGTIISDLKPGAIITGITLAEVLKDYSDYPRTNPPSLGAIQIDNPLPVLLSQFTYRINLRDIILNWTTSSEVNNTGFDVERAGNRQQAPGNWEKIGFVTGKGTTNTQTSYTFTDTKLNAGKYQYRLKQIDNNGNFEYHNLNGIVEVGLPTKYTLSQNYPNPFNPTTKIDFALPNDSKVSIKVYDITGREVMNIMNNEQKTAGYYTININPSMLSSGVYFYRMISDKFIETKKMAILK